MRMLSSLYLPFRRAFSCCPSGNTAIYEVAVRFNDTSVKDEYKKWLTSKHIQEVLHFPGFLSAELQPVYENGDSSGAAGVVVKYTLESVQVFEEYNKSEVAKKLRSDALELFGDKFTASRKVLLSGDVFYK